MSEQDGQSSLHEDSQQPDESSFAQLLRQVAAAPAQAPLPTIGERVAGYEILELLGQGGMGRVYLALDLQLGREVALKFLAPKVAGLAERETPFEREARAMARLNHPRIVTVYTLSSWAKSALYGHGGPQRREPKSPHEAHEGVASL